jgi:hypothetical protein
MRQTQLNYTRLAAGGIYGCRGSQIGLKLQKKPDPRDPYRKPLICKGLRLPGYSVPGAQTYASDRSAHYGHAAWYSCVPARARNILLNQ